MVEKKILDMLEQISRSSVARLSPSVTVGGDTAQARRDNVLQIIRGTILPRRLEFTAANGDCLAIEVNSSRVTDVFRVQSGEVPDFETESRDALTEKLAHLVSDIAKAPSPLELMSLRPDVALEADDVGITLREIQEASANIDLPVEPTVSVVPDVEPELTEDPAQSVDRGLAEQFFDRAERFALGRVLIDGDNVQCDGDCAEDRPAHPDPNLLNQLVRDLNGWSDECEAVMDLPQLVVMRPSGGRGSGLAIVYDGEQTVVAVHEARKLGSVVNTWAELNEDET